MQLSHFITFPKQHFSSQTSCDAIAKIRVAVTIPHSLRRCHVTPGPQVVHVTRVFLYWGPPLRRRYLTGPDIRHKVTQGPRLTRFWPVGLGIRRETRTSGSDLCCASRGKWGGSRVYINNRPYAALRIILGTAYVNRADKRFYKVWPKQRSSRL